MNIGSIRRKCTNSTRKWKGELIRGKHEPKSRRNIFLRLLNFRVDTKAHLNILKWIMYIVEESGNLKIDVR